MNLEVEILVREEAFFAFVVANPPKNRDCKPMYRSSATSKKNNELSNQKAISKTKSYFWSVTKAQKDWLITSEDLGIFCNL